MTQAHTGIELWLVDLERCGPALARLERETARLAGDELARAGAIGDAAVRAERIAAHTALRILLERAAGAGTRRRPFVRGPSGAPRLADGGVRFSLSHTEGFAMIGLAAALPIGVDLERTRPVSLPPRRRDELMAAAVGLGGGPLPDGDRAVVQAWVRLEAFTKARGRALIGTLTDLGLRGAGHRPPVPAHPEAAARALAAREGLAVSDLGLPAGLQGAAAIGGGGRLPAPRALPADRAGLEALLGRPWSGPDCGSG
jgi:4'-phosphopantetheinyl transferase